MKSLHHWHTLNSSQNGHANVTKSEGELGQFVKRQRTVFRKGKMKEDRVRRLLELGFDFDPRNKRGEGFVPDLTSLPVPDEVRVQGLCNTPEWESSFLSLKSFVEKNGHAEVPPGLNDNELHSWLETQKSFFEQGTLPWQQIKMFRDLGVDLGKKVEFNGDRSDLYWLHGFTALKEFYDEHGHTEVERDYMYGNEQEGYRSLGLWASKQVSSECDCIVPFMRREDIRLMLARALVASSERGSIRRGSRRTESSDSKVLGWNSMERGTRELSTGLLQKDQCWVRIHPTIAGMTIKTESREGSHPIGSSREWT